MEIEEPEMPNNDEPNEVGGFHVEGHIKIYDPDTGEVFRDQRS